jgi:uncharacterized membrane-anchored protein
LPWSIGPKKLSITNRAVISLNNTTRFLDTDGTSKLLTLNGNLPESNSYTVASADGTWFAIFDFEDIGFVKDDEKIDAASLLRTLQENQVEANKQRVDEGLDALTIKGWAVPPHYDPATHNLEYGLNLASGGGDSVNYRMRILGRRGVMNATLITVPQYLNADLTAFRATQAGFSFNKDETYAAFKEGDKVSEYGLAALVTGGAAAALVKGGLLKGLFVAIAAFWKLILAGVIAFGAAIKRIFFRRSDNDDLN